MKKSGIMGLCILALAGATFAGPCSGPSCSGGSEWSAALKVLMVGSNLSKSSTHGYFNRFGLSGNVCPSGMQYSELRVPDSEYALVKFNNMKAALLTAMSAGQSVRVLWEGNYCWVSDVVVCESGENCPVY